MLKKLFFELMVLALCYISYVIIEYLLVKLVLMKQNEPYSFRRMK